MKNVKKIVIKASVFHSPSITQTWVLECKDKNLPTVDMSVWDHIEGLDAIGELRRKIEEIFLEYISGNHATVDFIYE